MAIHRGKRPADRFAQISNEALEDESLSFRARGLLAYLLSRPEGWSTSGDKLTLLATEGRDAVLAALNELERAGYISRFKIRGDKGRFKHEMYVNDFPTFLDEDATPPE